ncbi:MAG TPA: cytochrome C oxidase subunit IV family protein [Chthoniobacter sp.]|jgi:cytochrome c oxidase subunit 4
MSDHPTPSTAAESHDHGHSHEDIARHVKGYFMVGGALLVCTGLTVALSYVDFDKYIGGHNWNFIVAMILAAFKAGLVAAIFMHLKQEKMTIWKFLLFTAFFCLGLFLLTLLHWVDPISGTTRSHHF